MSVVTGRRARRSMSVPAWTARICVGVIALYAFVTVFAPLLSPYGETEIVGAPFEPASSEFWMGTDNLGRDMLSRLIWGARNTVGVALAVTVLSFVIGGTLGLMAAVRGGLADQVLSRVADALMALPPLVLALLLLTVFGTGFASLVTVIALIDATRVFRVARAAGLDVASMDYVEAARIRGEGLFSIIGREVLPNVKAPLTAEFGLRFCFVFLFIATLSFLGLGLQPPAADWGGMVRDNASLVLYAELTPLYPALAMAVLTVAVNLTVDHVLKRAADPRS